MFEVVRISSIFRQAPRPTRIVDRPFAHRISVSAVVGRVLVAAAAVVDEGGELQRALVDGAPLEVGRAAGRREELN